MIQEPSRSATRAAISAAREMGATIAFDPNLRPPLWSDLNTAKETILGHLHLADLVKISDVEGEFLWGPGEAEDWGRQAREFGPRLVAVTLGSGGCLLSAGSITVLEPAWNLPVVDTTGAGDAFHAGLIVRVRENPGLLESPTEAELRDAARWANACGMLACCAVGGISAMPSRAAVETFLQEQSPRC